MSAAAAAIWLVVLHTPATDTALARDLMFEPGIAYASPDPCEARAKFFHAYVPLDGEFKCMRFEVSK